MILRKGFKEVGSGGSKKRKEIRRNKRNEKDERRRESEQVKERERERERERRRTKCLHRQDDVNSCDHHHRQCASLPSTIHRHIAKSHKAGISSNRCTHNLSICSPTQPFLRRHVCTHPAYSTRILCFDPLFFCSCILPTRKGRPCLWLHVCHQCPPMMNDCANPRAQTILTPRARFNMQQHGKKIKYYIY